MADYQSSNKPNIPPQAEDAVGDGGEAVATFSAYIPPKWAADLQLPRAVSDTSGACSPTVARNGMVPAAKSPPGENTDVICIDCSDDDEELEIVSSKEISSTIPSTNDDPKNMTVPLSNKLSHSSPACESGLLASVSAPEPSKECLRVISELVQQGKLSPLQAEGSGLAIQRHCRLLRRDKSDANSSQPKYMRAGFFIGDGAGVGKGRQIAAVIRDSYCRSVKDASKGLSSRRRHLWLSVSRELIEDAKRDLEDIGCYAPVLDGADGLSNVNKKSFNNDQSAVLFITYALLISGKGSKIEEIISWLIQGQCENTFDGCIIFDEAHKAKNLCQDPPTATGRLVMLLQERLPNARIVYCSATGVSDLKQMAYAVRLGLWGPGTNFATFDIFRESLEKRGVGAMELLALEMKQAGCFVARTLSWDGAEFQTVKVKLSPEQVNVYDNSMKWWEKVKTEMKDILCRPDMNGTPKMLWSQYWSAIQRFSKELAICAKVPILVDDALAQLKEGNSVVIGLQSTGESSTQFTLEELERKLTSEGKKTVAVEEIHLDSLLSTSQAIMTTFIRNHFPVAPQPLEPIKIPPIPDGGFKSEMDKTMHMHFVSMNEKIKSQPPPQPKPELLALRKQLLGEVTILSLPPTPLDDIIDRLGGTENVAEMTGRSGRCVRVPNSIKYRFEKRVGISKEKKFGLSAPLSEEDADRLNITEKKKFMDGRKSVAVISDAASTGISLHTSAKSKARDRRRVHFTIELPWAADKAIQQLGRTHRSGQISAPIYKMVVTELGGERRFAAAVSKRMASLGALTKGDRRAATGSDLSEFDIDSRFGRRALKRFYNCMLAEPPYTPSKGATAILDSYWYSLKDYRLDSVCDWRIFVLNEAKDCLESIGIEPKAETKRGVEVKTFLNRIAALTVGKQNLVFSLFTSTMDDVIAEAKTTGEFEGSVEDIRATTIELTCSPENLITDASSGAHTKLATFLVDRGCSLQRVTQTFLDMIPIDQDDDEVIEGDDYVAKSGFYISRHRIMGRYLVLFAKRKVQLTDEEDTEKENRIDSDPLGLMVLTRPNTGTNPYEKSTADLEKRYKLVASVDDVKNIMNDTRSKEDLMTVLEEKYPMFWKLWNDTFVESNNVGLENGLAPRCSKLGIVTGAVLHCLPALEQSVATRKLAERSLKIIRVETSTNVQRMVGMRYPVDNEALINLRCTMQTLTAARAGGDGAAKGGIFIDEMPGPIQGKSVEWISSPPKTMKSFFTPDSKVMKRKHLPNEKNTPATENKRMKIGSTQKKTGRTKSITSFFSKPK
mmetsp:Transcript_31465/g.46405  ORF Transcript_31465/g.46405 Transcript_31465/m.46405 type:complete len:1291 (+) Transcript_31465:79-3951(+)